MSISTEKSMTAAEIESFQTENKEILTKLGNKNGTIEEIKIEIPNYSLIDGTSCATVKLGSKRRKTGINDV